MHLSAWIPTLFLHFLLIKSSVCFLGQTVCSPSSNLNICNTSEKPKTDSEIVAAENAVRNNVGITETRVHMSRYHLGTENSRIYKERSSKEEGNNARHVDRNTQRSQTRFTVADRHDSRINGGMPDRLSARQLTKTVAPVSDRRLNNRRAVERRQSTRRSNERMEIRIRRAVTDRRSEERKVRNMERGIKDTRLERRSLESMDRISSSELQRLQQRREPEQIPSVFSERQTRKIPSERREENRLSERRVQRTVSERQEQVPSNTVLRQALSERREERAPSEHVDKRRLSERQEQRSTERSDQQRLPERREQRSSERLERQRSSERAERQRLSERREQRSNERREERSSERADQQILPERREQRSSERAERREQRSSERADRQRLSERREQRSNDRREERSSERTDQQRLPERRQQRSSERAERQRLSERREQRSSEQLERQRLSERQEQRSSERADRQRLSEQRSSDRLTQRLLSDRRDQIEQFEQKEGSQSEFTVRNANGLDRQNERRQSISRQSEGSTNVAIRRNSNNRLTEERGRRFSRSVRQNRADRRNTARLDRASERRLEQRSSYRNDYQRFVDSLRQSKPIRERISRLRTNTQVRERLDAPIEHANQDRVDNRRIETRASAQAIRSDEPLTRRSSARLDSRKSVLNRSERIGENRISERRALERSEERIVQNGNRNRMADFRRIVQNNGRESERQVERINERLDVTRKIRSLKRRQNPKELSAESGLVQIRKSTDEIGVRETVDQDTRAASRRQLIVRKSTGVMPKQFNTENIRLLNERREEYLQDVTIWNGVNLLHTTVFALITLHAVIKQLDMKTKMKLGNRFTNILSGLKQKMM